jgi:N6-L-threonylcarbamoyladenine synthase
VRILGLETSCDETAAAVVVDGRTIESSVVSTQIALHAPFGGVVPEIAGRAHVERIVPVIHEALERAGSDRHGRGIDAVACTIGPGLIGALLVGVSAAKSLAWAWGVPFLGVNHLEGHLASPFLEAGPDDEPELPLLTLLVSGGHTLLVLMHSATSYDVLGSTIDDAAGEAYDKVARMLKLGYPGGPVIDRLAENGNPTAVAFPRALRDRPNDFSFSGLKTAVANHLRLHPSHIVDRPADIAASFQEAVVDVLAEKARAAGRRQHVRSLAIGGGVAANSSLRARMVSVAADEGWRIHIPDRSFCTDNAAMIAAAAWWWRETDAPLGLNAAANPNLRLRRLALC